MKLKQLIVKKQLSLLVAICLAMGITTMPAAAQTSWKGNRFLSNNQVINENIVLIGNVTISVGAGHTATINGSISGNYIIEKYGDGTLILNGVNTYTGGTFINQGTLALGATGSIEHSSRVEFFGYRVYAGQIEEKIINSNGILDISAGNKKIKKLVAERSDEPNIILGSSMLTIGTYGQNDGGGHYRGSFSGTGSVQKTGTEAFYMTNSYNQNTATGRFFHQQGEVVVDGIQRSYWRPNWAGTYDLGPEGVLTVAGHFQAANMTLHNNSVIDMNLRNGARITGAINNLGITTLNIFGDASSVPFNNRILIDEVDFNMSRIDPTKYRVNLRGGLSGMSATLKTNGWGELLLDVTRAPQLTGGSASAITLPDAVRGRMYTYSMPVTGSGAKTVDYTPGSNPVPDGMQLGVSANALFISGTPSNTATAGGHSFSLRVTSQEGHGYVDQRFYMYVHAPVTGITGVPTVIPGGEAYRLPSFNEVLPVDASRNWIDWSVESVTNGPNVNPTLYDNGSYYFLYTTGGGQITLRATVYHGLGSGQHYTRLYNITVTPPDFPVSEITGVPTTVLAGSPLALKGAVVPFNARNTTITWSISNAGTTGATIAPGNMLHTTGAGTATVRATVVDGLDTGQDYTQDFPITVTPIIPVEAVRGIPQKVGITSLVGGWPFVVSAFPRNATNSFPVNMEVVPAGTTSAGATITFSGDAGSIGWVLTTFNPGNVRLRATIQNGVTPVQDFTQEFDVTVESGYQHVSSTDITDIPYIWYTGIPLSLADVGTVVPSNATFQEFFGTVINAGTTNAVITDGKTLTATNIGSVTIRLTIPNGRALGGGGDIARDFSILIEEFVPVDGISGVPSMSHYGNLLALPGTKPPPSSPPSSTTSFNDIQWSIPSGGAGTTGATIVGGVPNFTSNGLATVRITIPNGLGPGLSYTQDFLIAVAPPIIPFTPVADITGVPTTMTVGEELTLSGTIEPFDADNQTITWSIQSPGSTGATLTGGNVLEAMSAGTVWVRATIANGTSLTQDYTNDFEITVNDPPFVAVTDIIVPDAASIDISLTLTGTIVPWNATNRFIDWTVVSTGTTGATLDPATNELTGTAAGTVTIRATILDGTAAGTDYTKTFTVTVYPPPVITTTSLPDGAVGAAYNHNLTASGGATVTWYADDDDLPLGLTLSSDGIISGTPEAAGSFTFAVIASDNVGGADAKEFTIVIGAAKYAIYIGTFTGGSVSANMPSGAVAGQTVTLTITCSKDYELQTIAVTRNDNGEDISLSVAYLTRTFTMPACDVTVTATFLKTNIDTRWDRAKSLIEGTKFAIPQATANTADALRFPLASIINALIAETDIVISSNDIVIFVNFLPATAGDAGKQSGTNGYFEFRVSPPNLSSAYTEGTITATSYDPTSNDVLPSSVALKAWVNNGVLHVSGLTPGKEWRIYNMTGILIYQAVARDDKASIPLPARGVYIITSGESRIKFVN